MSFLYDLADTKYKTSVLYQSGSWTKPQGITMVSITAIGAGGGGLGGATGAVTTTRQGGSGGGSGNITRLIIPEMFITDSLIINIGIGGNGGASGGGVGGNGGNTTVDMPVRGNTDIYTRVIIASGGTGGVSIAPGAGAAASVIGDALYSSMGVWMSLAGVNGGGGSGIDGLSVTFASGGLPITGGAGGGGMTANVTTSSSGGAITGAGFVPTNPGGVGNTASSGGTMGVYSITPFYSLGGSGGGGGGTTPVSGGNGGNGNPGCGGGGGGGGTSPTGAGGTGGRGGDGLVIIQCW
jgi:hypothetical protein